MSVNKIIIKKKSRYGGRVRHGSPALVSAFISAAVQFIMLISKRNDNIITLEKQFWTQFGPYAWPWLVITANFNSPRIKLFELQRLGTSTKYRRLHVFNSETNNLLNVSLASPFSPLENTSRKLFCFKYSINLEKHQNLYFSLKFVRR